MSYELLQPVLFWELGLMGYTSVLLRYQPNNAAVRHGFSEEVRSEVRIPQEDVLQVHAAI